MNKTHSNQTPRNVQGREIDLREYFRVIVKKLWLIVLITILTTLAGHYYSQSTNVPIYQTSTRVLIGPEAGDMKTLMVMVEDPLVLEEVKNGLGLKASAGALSGIIDVNRIDESQVVEISVTNQDSARAAAIANETAKAFKAEAASILNATDIQLLSPALESTSPINGNQNKLAMVGFALGLAFGTGLVFLMDSLDGSIRKPRDVEEMLGIPVLGSVSKMKRGTMSNKKRKIKQKDTGTRSEVIGTKQKANSSQI